MSNITLKSQRFNKNKFNETVDTKFSQLLNIPDPTYFDRDLATEEDFFWLYDKFFYVIPKYFPKPSINNTLSLLQKYPNNNHTYLAQTSYDYLVENNIEFSKINIEVQALLDEIAEIRKENLQLTKESVNLETAIDTSVVTPSGVRLPTGNSEIDNSTTYG